MRFNLLWIFRNSTLIMNLIRTLTKKIKLIPRGPSCRFWQFCHSGLESFDIKNDMTGKPMTIFPMQSLGQIWWTTWNQHFELISKNISFRKNNLKIQSLVKSLVNQNRTWSPPDVITQSSKMKIPRNFVRMIPRWHNKYVAWTDKAPLSDAKTLQNVIFF